MPRDSYKVNNMVAESVLSLQQQEVFVIDIGIRHVDVNKDLARKKLKLKLRMNGLTHFKTKAWKATNDIETPLRMAVDNTWSTIFEGDGQLKLLQLELCQACCLGASRKLAGCSLPLLEVLDSLEAGRFDRRVCNYELESKRIPGKILATIELDICVRVSTLEAAGGVEALKWTTLPPMPQQNVALLRYNEFRKYAAQCKAFVEQAAHAKESLQGAFAWAAKAERVSEQWQEALRRAASDPASVPSKLAGKECEEDPCGAAADILDDVSTSCGSSDGASASEGSSGRPASTSDCSALSDGTSESDCSGRVASAWRRRMASPSDCSGLSVSTERCV